MFLNYLKMYDPHVLYMLLNQHNRTIEVRGYNYVRPSNPHVVHIVVWQLYRGTRAVVGVLPKNNQINYYYYL
jgi:hypothetical protein